ncbi:ATP-binding cassette domain-containing protein [Mesoflavibacter zeaxanthinifaciens]|uniref:ATP-binding cassette domain-containing protein n=1 Tax=Mesoflavibacter zeaxanthinifaciens TaxID=393060 RepID=UPI0026EACE69|nr:ATP-binding cassette domain-containing protein [Mesoflavibacter zeaxanthinifaciens]
MTFEIDNIELHFKDKRILNGIYLKAKTGKVTSILGRNGSGKSCLINIAFGILKAKYCNIRIDNKQQKKKLYQTKKATFLPQYHYTPNRAKLASVFKLFKVKWNDFIENFPEFSNLKHSKFNELSGGQRRVIEIYLILKKASEIILLDEPFSNISPLYIEKIKSLIEIEKKQKVIILTDHNYEVVIDISDDIYLLKNGCTKLIKNINELEDYNYLSPGTLN